MIFYELMPEVSEALSRCWYDTAASPFIYKDDIYRIAPQVAGGEKILFGSDYPLIPAAHDGGKYRGFTDGSFYGISLSPGYAYTLTKYNFFVSAMVKHRPLLISKKSVPLDGEAPASLPILTLRIKSPHPPFSKGGA